MIKVDFKRKKYLTISFSQLLNNFSYLVFSYLYVNSDDIIFNSTAFEKQLYNLIDKPRVCIFPPIESNVFRTAEFPSIRGQTVHQKYQPKSIAKSSFLQGFFFLLFSKRWMLWSAQHHFFWKRKWKSGRWIRKTAFSCHRSVCPGMYIAGTVWYVFWWP